MANDWVDVPEPKGTVTVEGADPVAFGTAAGVTALGGKGVWDTKKALWNKEGVNAYKPKSGGLQSYLNSQVHAPGVMSNVKLDQLSKISGMPTQTPAQVQAALAELGGAPAVPGTPSQRVPVTKMINGVPTITHYNTIPGTPEIPAKPHINLSDLARENYGPVQKQIAQLGFEKPAAAVMNVAKPLIQYAAKPLAIAGGAGEFQDAYNRYKNDDYVGAGISAVGGLGSLATMIPHPATRAIGTGVALGAPALNYAIDKFSKPKVANTDDGWKDAPEHAEGGSIDLPAMAGEIMRNHLEAKKPKPKPKHTIHTLPPGLTKEQFTHLCMGGHVEMAEGGQPPKSNANEGSAFVGYPQITNKPRDPNFKQQSGPILGAIDALIGAGPRSDISILNPQDLKYSESYDKFEPYGIAANVLPMLGGPMKAVGKAAAKELGPKAAGMAENYLTKIGGIAHAIPPNDQFFEPIKKSGAQLKREANYAHDVVPTHNFSEPNKISIADLQGGYLVGVPGDRSLAGHSLMSVNGVPLNKAVALHGGPRYGQRKLDLGEDAFWASQKGAAGALQNKAANAAEMAKGNPVFGMYTAMAPDASNYALHHTEALVNQLEALSPNKAKLRAFDEMIKSSYPEFLGMSHPEIMNQFSANSDLRKYVADRLNKSKIASEYGMPSGEATIHAITDPALRNVKTGTTGYSVGELNPFKTLSPELEHPTYDTQIPGKFKGQMIAQLPWQEYFPNAAKKIAANPEQAPYAWGTFKMGDFHQPVNQELVDRIAPIEEMIKSASKDFKSSGGAVEHFQVGGLAALGKALIRHPHGQDARVAQALEEYLKGNISQAERINILNQHLPIRQWTDLPPNYTDEQIKNALMANKQAKALAPVAAGARVGNRLDIPAYTQHGVYVDTTHDLAAGNSPISYNRTGHLKDVEFSSKPNQAVRVGLGTKEQALTPMGAEMGSAKSPFALIKGTNVGTSDDEVRRMMADMMKDPNYTQIGMDPRRHSQFYDKSTGMPVFAAEEKLQSGPLIIAPKKGLETTSWDDPRLNLTDFPGKQYKKGGKAKKK